MDAKALCDYIMNNPALVQQFSNLIQQELKYDGDKLWEEQYYFYDFIRDFVDGKQYYGADWKTKINKDLKPALLKIIRIVELGSQRIVVLKTGTVNTDKEIGDFIMLCKLQDFKKNHSIINRHYYTISHQTTKGGKAADEKVWLYDMILTDADFRFRQIDWIPTSPIEDKINYKDVFNTFSGFKAKEVDIPNMELIQFFLDHIKEVWADGNELRYNYILDHFSTSVQYPRMHIPVPVLIGKEGAGKTVPLEFWLNHCIGTHCTTPVSGLESVVGTFNSIIANKFAVLLLDADGVDGNSSTIWTRMNAFKPYVTDPRVEVREKHVNARQMSNYIHWYICSNFLESIRVGDDARRYAIFIVSDKYRGNETYFKTFCDKLTSEVADHLLTFFLQREITNNLNVDQESVVDGKMAVLNISLHSSVRFWIEWTSCSWRCEGLKDPITIIDVDDKYCAISKQDIYTIYKYWCSKGGYISCNLNIFFKKIRDYTLPLPMPIIDYRRQSKYVDEHCVKFPKDFGNSFKPLKESVSDKMNALTSSNVNSLNDAAKLQNDYSKMVSEYLSF